MKNEMQGMEAVPSLSWSRIVDYVIDLLHFSWLRRGKFFTILIFLLALEVAAIIILPVKYTSSASILPAQSNSSLKSLASIAGVSMNTSFSGGGFSNELLPPVFRSKRVIGTALQSKYNDQTFLQIFLEGKEPNEERVALVNIEVLKNLIVTSDRWTEFCTVQFSYNDPNVASAFLEQLLVEVDSYITTEYKTTLASQLATLDIRIHEVVDSLEVLENKYVEFRERNRITSDSPQLSVEEQRFQRDIQTNTAIYVELQKQFELLKVDDIQQRPMINILDRATTPVFRSSPPSRALILILLAIFTFLAEVFSFRYSGTIRTWLRGFFARIFAKESIS